MAEPVYYMDLTAGETTAKYPTDGKGGNTATSPGTSCQGAEWVILGVQVLASDAGAVDVTITAANGSTFVVIVDGSGGSTAVGDVLVMPFCADLAAETTGTPAISGAVTPPQLVNGIPVGKTFSAAMDASTAANYRIIFAVAT